jgi:16S rRNA G966 N2-methylase RsmD
MSLTPTFPANTKINKQTKNMKTIQRQPNEQQQLHYQYPNTKQELDKLKKIYPSPPQKFGVVDDPYKQLVFSNTKERIFETPKRVVRDITSKMFNILEKERFLSRGQRTSIIDTTGGSDTINLARSPNIEHVFAIEMDLARFAALKENVSTYSLEDKITLYNESFIDWLKKSENMDKIRKFPVYMEYNDSEDVADKLQQLLDNYLNDANFIVLKVPTSFNTKAINILGFNSQEFSYENVKYIMIYRIKQNGGLRKESVSTKRYRQTGIYTSMMITQKAFLSILNVGDNIKQTLEKYISQNIEGKCIAEGYIKPGSTKIVSYSSGELNGTDVVFEVIFECLVCCPVEGMHIECMVKNITETAGIRAETDETPSPLVIYIARDHHFNNPQFSKVKIGDKIKVRVIGQRYELNDKYISIIAELLEDKKERVRKPRKLIISD